ncbi:hypothetical protein Tco_0058288 [Tanacetum coccineum]
MIPHLPDPKSSDSHVKYSSNCSLTDVSSTKPTHWSLRHQSNGSYNITTSLLENHSFIALAIVARCEQRDLESIKNQEFEKSPKEIIRIKREQAQPPPKDDDQSSKKPRESDASTSKQHPALTSTGWQITDTRDDVVNSSMPRSDTESEHSEQSSDDIPMQDEGHVSDLEDTDNAHIPKVSTTTWFKLIPEGERPATPEPEWTIPPNDFPEPENNWANTYATMYQVPAENKLQRKTYDIGSFIKWFCRRTGKKKLCKADLEGPAFNLVKAFHKNSVFLQYQMDECHKLLMNMVDLGDGTLTRVMEKLDHMVKDFHLFEYNKGMKSRKWSEDDKRRSKDFITAIEKRLQIRRIFRSLESFVGERIEILTTVVKRTNSRPPITRTKNALLSLEPKDSQLFSSGHKSILLSFTHCGNKSIQRVLRIILVILPEHPSETMVFHNKDGNPARANIKQALGR